VIRLAGRLGLTVVALAVLAVVCLQFARVAARNYAVWKDLSAERAQIADLRERERRQELTIRRLSDPHGAIPEIHEKLQLVGPHEELIFVRRAAAASAEESTR
jgi:cell division protein FtsB